MGHTPLQWVGHLFESQQEELNTPRDFPWPDLGPNIGPFQFENKPKLPKIVFIIPNFLVLHFGENFIKIRTKIAKLQIHEILHKNVNETCCNSHFLYKFP